MSFVISHLPLETPEFIGTGEIATGFSRQLSGTGNGSDRPNYRGSAMENEK
jgi:hypothetical protein